MFVGGTHYEDSEGCYVDCLIVSARLRVFTRLEAYGVKQ